MHSIKNRGVVCGESIWLHHLCRADTAWKPVFNEIRTWWQLKEQPLVSINVTTPLSYDWSLVCSLWHFIFALLHFQLQTRAMRHMGRREQGKKRHVERRSGGRGAGWRGGLKGGQNDSESSNVAHCGPQHEALWVSPWHSWHMEIVKTLFTLPIFVFSPWAGRYGEHPVVDSSYGRGRVGDQ